MSMDLNHWLTGASILPGTSNTDGFEHWLDGAPVIAMLPVGTAVPLPQDPVVVFSEDEVVFVGEVMSVSVKGRIISARGQAGGSIFDRQVPRFRLQNGCNHTLFDVGCGLAKAAWKFSATMAFPGTPGFPFEFTLDGLQRVSGPVPTFFEHWFVGGWIEFGAGSTWCRRAILRSTAVTAGAATVTLSRDPEPFPEAGDPVVLYPGCDGRFETCKAYHLSSNPSGKFGNPLNFGGHPFVPIGNPSLLKVSAAVGGGKK